MEVLSSSKPVPGFQGGTVTKMEKIRHGFGHYSSYTFYPIWLWQGSSNECLKWSQRVNIGPKMFNMVLNVLQGSQMVLNGILKKLTINSIG